MKKKPHKWTAAQRKKFIETMRQKRETQVNGLKPPKHKTAFGGTKEAIVYLQHAERIINLSLRNGKHTVLTQDQLLTLLALRALRGG